MYFHHRLRCAPRPGAQPLMTQVVKGDIKVIIPRDYREVDPIFPLKAALDICGIFKGFEGRRIGRLSMNQKGALT